MPTECWMDLTTGGERLGGAFRLTDEYVVTATHCIPVPEVGAEVTLVHELSHETKAEIAEVRGDLALLRLVDPEGSRAAVAHPTPAEDHMRWTTKSRPSASHPNLTGTVSSASLAYRCETDELIEALQLSVDQDLGSHKGYSGGPVQNWDPNAHPSAVIGLLLEELPDPVTTSTATNVLFAASTAALFDSFAALDSLCALGMASVDAPAGAIEVDLLGSELDTRIRRAEAILQAAINWANNGLITPTEYTLYQARVREFVFDEMAGEDER